ncbi:MAG: magnesium/cobalt transporter CorA [Candidatus Marinimicrobia bacterium]|nr:magnesium/cobalt transporter CorA [Candidatus Neomarinimicrobiota bacterium]MCF7840595.1 magnesium/cobalt transporter CorA [Candidatus Neomarinimicrobiota bacterium]
MPHRRKSNITQKIGQSPGVLIHVGAQRAERVDVVHYYYDADHFQSNTLPKKQPEIPTFIPDRINWIKISGLNNVDFIDRVGRKFNLHPLVVEDILNTEHTPKIEDYEDYVFLTMKSLAIKRRDGSFIPEQVSLVLGKGYVLAFQELPSPIFRSVEQRLNNAQGRGRKRGSDYLFYMLVDVIVDHYYQVVDDMNTQLDDIEEEILTHPKEEILGRLQSLRKDLVFLRRIMIPMRDAIGNLQKTGAHLIEPDTIQFFTDTWDHLNHIINEVESARELIPGLLDLYMSTVSNSMNEVMKVLTIVATIFIPLTFIAGVYGMNFDHMPELHWRYGYASIWGIMLIVMGGMVYYFRRKKWL